MIEGIVLFPRRSGKHQFMENEAAKRRARGERVLVASPMGNSGFFAALDVSSFWYRLYKEACERLEMDEHFVMRRFILCSGMLRDAGRAVAFRGKMNRRGRKLLKILQRQRLREDREKGLRWIPFVFKIEED